MRNTFTIRGQDSIAQHDVVYLVDRVTKSAIYDSFQFFATQYCPYSPSISLDCIPDAFLHKDLILDILQYVPDAKQLNVRAVQNNLDTSAKILHV